MFSHHSIFDAINLHTLALNPIPNKKKETEAATAGKYLKTIYIMRMAARLQPNKKKCIKCTTSKGLDWRVTLNRTRWFQPYIPFMDNSWYTHTHLHCIVLPIFFFGL